MEYIDLHMHSLYSDGTDSPDELVRRAKEAGLSMIALTDHNTLDGIMDFREACRRHGMTGIGGIELSTGWEDAVLPAAADGSQTAGSKPGFPDKEPPEIHILGYFSEDTDLSAASFAPLRKVVEDYHLLKLRHNEAIVQRIADAAPGADLGRRPGQRGGLSRLCPHTERLGQLQPRPHRPLPGADRYRLLRR